MTWYDKPCIGAKVFATEVSKELVTEWLNLYDKEQEPSPVIFETETGHDGSFAFPELEAKTYCIRAEFEDHGYDHGLLDLSNGWDDDFLLKIKRGRAIQGAVIDSSGKPVDGVELTCIRSINSDIIDSPLDVACDLLIFSLETTTNSKGEFHFRGLPMSAYYLYAEPDGYNPVDKRIDISDLSFQTIYLKRPCVVRGKVKDLDGNPIENADVWYRYPQGGLQVVGPFNTGKEGEFRFDDAPEGSLALQAIQEEEGNATCRLVAQPGVECEKDLVLTGGVKIDLTVTDGKGEPLEGVVVTVEDWSTGAFPASGYTDEKGYMRLDGINRGSQIRLRAKLSGYFNKYGALHTFQESSSLEIVLKRRVPTFLKIFDGDTGKTITKYHVCITPFSSFTGAVEKFHTQRGIYEFDFEKDLYEIYVGEGETFGFTFYADGYLPGRITVVPSGSNTNEKRVLDVPLKKSGNLNGTVVDAISGDPVQGAKISLYMRGTLNKKPIRALSTARASVTAEDGTFSIDGIAEGRVFFKVQADGYAQTMLDSCELDPREGDCSNIVKLWPGGLLEGTVLNVLGHPLEDASVQVIPEGTDEVVTGKTRPDGTYVVPGLPSGQLDVLVEDSYERLYRGSWMKLRKVVSMPKGGSRTVDFDFSGSCIIRGTCSYEGNPDWGIALDLIDSTGNTVCTANSANDGYYRIFGIPPGEYSLKANSTLSGTGGSCIHTIELSEGEELILDIDLADKAIHGQVKGPDGAPIHGAVVELLTKTFGRSHSTFTDQKGNFVILNVDEGTYSIAAKADNCAEAIQGPWPLGGGHPVQKADFNLETGGIGRIVVNRNGEPKSDSFVYLSADYSEGPLRRGITRDSGVCASSKAFLRKP